MDGINTLEDLAFIKALVVEAVKPDGFAILNADDIMARKLAPRVRSNLIYFSRNIKNPIIVEHLEKGNIAIVEDNGCISVYWQESIRSLLGIEEIPITFAGRAACNIENSLAAVCGLFALGIPDHIIRQGLNSFKPDPQLNAGRFNLFDMGNFQILLDYAHNPSGYKSVIQFMRCLESSRLVGIIGMPGDRMDQSIVEAGKIAGQNFAKIYIKEDGNLRGRLSGEVASLMYKGAIMGGAQEKDVQIVLSESEALESAIFAARAGDLIVMFYEKFEPAFNIVHLYSAGGNLTPILLSEPEVSNITTLIQ